MAADTAAPEMTDGAALETVRLWDPLLRVFHWALTLCVVGSWITGKFGPDIMTLHFYLGYAVLGLLAFRVVWGFVGPEHARFASFAYGPGAVARYVRGMFARAPSYWRGHNPLGAVFVFVLLGVLAVQATMGLFADPEDYLNVGPLAGLVGIDTARTALGWHHTLAPVILLLVGLHVAAIVFYKRWKHEDLIRPMVTGEKTVRRA